MKIFWTTIVLILVTLSGILTAHLLGHLEQAWVFWTAYVVMLYLSLGGIAVGAMDTAESSPFVFSGWLHPFLALWLWPFLIIWTFLREPEESTEVPSTGFDSES